MDYRDLVWFTLKFKDIPKKRMKDTLEAIYIGKDITVVKNNIDKNHIATIKWKESTLIDIKSIVSRLYGIQLKYMDKDKLKLDYGLGNIQFRYKDVRVTMIKSDRDYRIELKAIA